MSTHWPDAYRDLESLREQIGALTQDVHAARSLILHATRPGARVEVVQAFADAWNIRYDAAADWPRLLRLQEAESIDHRADSAEQPLSSVYHAAWFIQRLELAGTLDDAWFYRGQRDHRWQVTPKMLRALDRNSPAAARAEVDRRLEVIRSWVARVLARGLADDDFDALAVVQHYSRELDAATWLVDVTASPWVALFFASDGGCSGDVGVVELISRREWDYFSAQGRGHLGALRVAAVRHVPRIDSQAAMFLQAPHADLFEQLTNQRIHFRQESGVCFETSARTPPVLRATIYPERDAVLEALAGAVEHAPQARPLAWEPGDSLLQPPDASVYMQICEVALDDVLRQHPQLAEPARDVDWSVHFQKLAEFHVAARGMLRESPDAVSLHHLRRAVKRIVFLHLRSDT